jgi:hypothetical protein
MEEHAALGLKAWEAFYVVVGTSAGALTGLQFVVLTLITEGGTLRGTGATLAAFGSPTVVHFCMALLLSAIMSAPWLGSVSPGVAAALCGAGGLLYAIVVLGRALGQRDYKPVLEDWIWHTVLPILAYAALILAGVRLPADHDMLYVIATATLLFVFIGIHNAWDTVTYVMVDRARERQERAARERVASIAGATEPVSGAVGTPGASDVPPPPGATG